MGRGTSGKIFMALGPQQRSTRGQGAKNRQKEVGLFSHFSGFFARETFQEKNLKKTPLILVNLEAF